MIEINKFKKRHPTIKDGMPERGELIRKEEKANYGTLL